MKMTTTVNTWWRHQMETFSALLALCSGNSPVTGEFPAQRPVTRSFDVFFDLAPWINGWINDWVNNGEAGGLRRQCAHYDVIVMRGDYDKGPWIQFHTKYFPNSGVTSWWLPWWDVSEAELLTQKTVGFCFFGLAFGNRITYNRNTTWLRDTVSITSPGTPATTVPTAK